MLRRYTNHLLSFIAIGILTFAWYQFGSSVGVMTVMMSPFWKVRSDSEVLLNEYRATTSVPGVRDPLRVSDAVPVVVMVRMVVCVSPCLTHTSMWHKAAA